MKILNWLKLNCFNILLFIFILIMVSSIILPKNLSNLDEVWNYSFAKNIADGLVPYRDFNMVITPLLSFICALFLFIFGNELIVMRILATILISFIFFMSFIILRKLNVNKYISLISIFLLFLILKDYICIDYNFAILAVTLLLIYLDLKHYLKNSNYFENSLIYIFLTGLLCGICILFKQSTGFLISCANIFYPILLVKNKMDFKKYFKLTFIKIIGIIIPVFLLIIYLILNNAFYDFIDYTILGIKTFSNSISYFSLVRSNNIYIKVTSILLPLFILFTTIYLYIKKEKKLYGFWCYAIASLIVIYPIADNIHFLIGIFICLILFIYFLYNILFLNYDKIKKYAKIKIFFKETIKSFIVLFLICYLITSIIILKDYIINDEKKHGLNHYKEIPVSQALLNKINIIDEYIVSQKNNVYILDSEAELIMIPINKYYKDFNLFNKGNLGSKGEEGQIEKIKNLKNGEKILIKKSSRNWQSPEKVISYVINNLNKIGEINIFDIYEIK